MNGKMENSGYLMGKEDMEDSKEKHNYSDLDNHINSVLKKYGALTDKSACKSDRDFTQTNIDFLSKTNYFEKMSRL